MYYRNQISCWPSLSKVEFYFGLCCTGSTLATMPVCDNTCSTANDGYCDDGCTVLDGSFCHNGDGQIYSLPLALNSNCAINTDENDCGVCRTKVVSPSPPPPPVPPREPPSPPPPGSPPSPSPTLPPTPGLPPCTSFIQCTTAADPLCALLSQQVGTMQGVAGCVDAQTPGHFSTQSIVVADNSVGGYLPTQIGRLSSTLLLLDANANYISGRSPLKLA